MDEILATCPPEEIADALGQLHGLGNATRSHLMKLSLAYEARELWKEDGAASMAEWLCQRLNLSLQSARELLEVGHGLKGLPRIAEAYEAGLLSWDQVVALVRFATAENDAELAEQARSASVAQLEAAARRARALSARQESDNHRRRSLRWRWNHDESWLALSGRLPADQGAVVVTALERLASQAPPLPSGLYEDFESRAADALVELAGVRLGADSDADRATVVVHVDHDVLHGGEGGAELEDGIGLNPESARRLCCDARLQVLMHGKDGSPLGVGRTARTAPPWLSRYLKKKDRGCRFPGCHRRLGMAAHHIRWWIHDGFTEPENMVLLCRMHHRLVHEGRWSIRGHPGTKLTFIRPDGRAFQPGPPRLRPEIRDRLLPVPEG